MIMLTDKLMKSMKNLMTLKRLKNHNIEN